MTSTFLLRFKKQPTAFKKLLKKYSDIKKWYEPDVAVLLYQKIVENEVVNGVLEISLKCLASGKEVANVRVKIDESQSLDVLIYNQLHDEIERMGTNKPEAYTQLLEDLRHAFKWDQHSQDKTLGEILGVNKKEVTGLDNEQPERRKVVESPEMPCVGVDDELTRQSVSLTVVPTDEIRGVSTLLTEKATHIFDIDVLPSMMSLTDKIAEIQVMLKEGIHHLMDTFHLTGKTDPISILKQAFITDNYSEKLLAFLKSEYQRCNHELTIIKKEAKEQLELKCHDVQVEKSELVEAEIGVARQQLATIYDQRKQIEIQKLELKLKEEFDKELDAKSQEIKQEIFSHLTSEQAALVETCRHEVEVLVKPSVDQLIHENNERYQGFMKGLSSDLKFKQLEIEREQDRHEFETMLASQQQFQKEMMQLMQKNEVEVASKKSSSSIGDFILIGFILAIVAVGAWIFFNLGFVLGFIREVIAEG